MSSRDITYCGYSKCSNTDCERHATHSKMTYDSFAYFDDCPIHKQLVDDLRSAVSDIED